MSELLQASLETDSDHGRVFVLSNFVSVPAVARLLHHFALSLGSSHPWSCVQTFAIVLNGETEAALPTGVIQALDSQIVKFNVLDPGPPPLRVIADFVSSVLYWVSTDKDHVALIYAPLVDHPSYILMLSALAAVLSDKEAEADLGARSMAKTLAKLSRVPHPLAMTTSVIQAAQHRCVPPRRLHVNDQKYLRAFVSLCKEDKRLQPRSLAPAAFRVTAGRLDVTRLSLELYQTVFLNIKDGKCEAKDTGKELPRKSSSTLEGSKLLELPKFRRTLGGNTSKTTEPPSRTHILGSFGFLPDGPLEDAQYEFRLAADSEFYQRDGNAIRFAKGIEPLCGDFVLVLRLEPEKPTAPAGVPRTSTRWTFTTRASTKPAPRSSQLGAQFVLFSGHTSLLENGTLRLTKADFNGSTTAVSLLGVDFEAELRFLESSES